MSEVFQRKAPPGVFCATLASADRTPLGSQPPPAWREHERSPCGRPHPSRLSFPRPCHWSPDHVTPQQCRHLIYREELDPRSAPPGRELNQAAMEAITFSDTLGSGICCSEVSRGTFKKKKGATAKVSKLQRVAWWYGRFAHGDLCREAASARHFLVNIWNPRVTPARTPLLRGAAASSVSTVWHIVSGEPEGG